MLKIVLKYVRVKIYTNSPDCQVEKLFFLRFFSKHARLDLSLVGNADKKSLRHLADIRREVAGQSLHQHAAIDIDDLTGDVIRIG